MCLFSLSLSCQRKLDCPCDWVWGLQASLWSDLRDSVWWHVGAHGLSAGSGSRRALLSLAMAACIAGARAEDECVCSGRLGGGRSARSLGEESRAERPAWLSGEMPQDRLLSPGSCGEHSSERTPSHTRRVCPDPKCKEGKLDGVYGCPARLTLGEGDLWGLAGW